MKEPKTPPAIYVSYISYALNQIPTLKSIERSMMVNQEISQKIDAVKVLLLVENCHSMKWEAPTLKYARIVSWSLFEVIHKLSLFERS